MQGSMRDRLSIFNSEISNLQSTIQSQRELQVQRSGFTEEEVISFVKRKIDEAHRQSESEIMKLSNELQNEHNVARMYRGRFNDITKGTSGKDPNSDALVIALKDRLDHEASYVDSQETKIVDLKSQLSDVNLELHSEKQEVMNRERKSERILRSWLTENAKIKRRIRK